VYDTSDIKKGLKVTIDNSPYSVVEFQFVKPGKGQAFTRTKLKNLLTGAMLERTFRSGDRLAPAEVEDRAMQFLYKEGDMFVFMDTHNYEQVQLTPDLVGDAANYMIDGLMVDVLFISGRPVGATPPTFVLLKVTQTDPGFKGDTSGNTTKAATLESGLEVQVPLFINEGETLRIDTRTGAYCERVKR
jgi:elongation factor P